MTSFSIDAGRLHCKKLRDFLNQCKFKGMDIGYMESGGFISRKFTIKGESKDIKSVANAIQDYIKQLEAI